MSATSSIEWTDRTWNPVRGCSVISPGCVNCYAMKFAHRFSGQGKLYEGLTKQTKAGPQWTGIVRYVHDEVAAPLRWRKPARVFVNSMSDLFHDGVTDEQLVELFAVMANCPEHTFQVLTKRPERMRAFLARLRWRVGLAAVAVYGTPTMFALLPYLEGFGDFWERLGHGGGQPPKELAGFVVPNVWLGVSVENQASADARIQLLLETQAAVRFVSYEPALGPVDFSWMLSRGWCPEHDFDGGGCSGPCPTRRERGHRLGWVIVGGESGPGARPFDIAWARSAVQQCRASGVAVFVKQLGALPVEKCHGCQRTVGKVNAGWVDACSATHRDLIKASQRIEDRKGGDPSEWPEDLRVREFPGVRP